MIIMKLKNIKLVLSAFALLAVAGCTDLNVDVKSEYTDANFPSTDADMEAVCGPAYTAYKSTYGRWTWLMETCSTDEGMMAVNNGGWYDNGKYLQMDLHTWTTDNDIVYEVWNGLFSAISNCNQIKSILDDAPDTESKTKSLAQIRTMRALYYFWAMDNYGALPIITTFGEDTPQRSTRKEVAEFIESELKACMDILPTTVGSTTYGKPTKYMAETLLAKLYLNWAVYTTDDVANYTSSTTNTHLNDAVAMCDSVIQSGNYDLSDDWINKFKDSNGYKIKDFIYAFSYDWTTDETDLGGGLTHSRFWCHKFMQYTMGLSKKPSGPMRALPEFVDKYSLTGDERNNIWRGGVQYYEGTKTPYTVKIAKSTLNKYYSGSDADSTINWNYELSKELTIRGKNTNEYNTNLSILDLGGDELGLAMGYRNVKFYPSASSTNNFQSNDMPIFRYADVLLMKAEAILRGATATNGESAVSLVNQIRKCAGAPTVTSIDLDGLLDERAREFSDECWRRNDLIRFGHFEDDWGFKSVIYNMSNADKYRRIFPVPLSVMKLNTSWTQNTGY